MGAASRGSRPRIAVVGASYLQLPLIEKAREMGYEVHVFAWAAGDVGEAAADFFHPISITEKDAILEACRSLGVVGVCSIASDLAMVAVNHAAHALGLVCNPPECVAVTTNKRAMREALAAGGDPCPRCWPVGPGGDLSALDLRYPVVVKPTDRSGSRGVCRLEGPGGLDEAVARACNESLEGRALVEEFAGGLEYSVESISFRGHHTFLAMTEKSTTGAPSFIETGHREPARVSAPVRERAWRVAEHALITLGVENGAAHTEIKVDGERISIIEVGARMGGDCIGSHLVRCSTGVDFVRAVLQIACGEEPDLGPVSDPFPAEVRFVLDGEGMREFERVRSDEPWRILDVPRMEPSLLGAATDSSNRAGCYVARA